MTFFRTWCLLPMSLICFPLLPYLGLWLGSSVDGLGLICALALSIYYLPTMAIVSPWMSVFFKSGQFGATPTMLGHAATAVVFGAFGLSISWLNTRVSKKRKSL